MDSTHETELLRLTAEGDSESIKAYLEGLPPTEKGDVFEAYLATLYKGNGWLCEIKGGRGDRGADLLLYHPKTPETVSIIVQAKNWAAPLSFDNTFTELNKFERQGAPAYGCRHFDLISVNGFVEDAQKLKNFNMRLLDWNRVCDLIEKYDSDYQGEPEIELFEHNRHTYEEINEQYLETNRIAAVQPTGTGKSYLIAKLMTAYMDDEKLIMAPSNYILDQQKSRTPWDMPSTTFMTYAKGGNLTPEEIEELSPGLIVLDEFHRCGAEVWGAGVQKILDANLDALVFGTSATPIRYLDSSRDMSDELFDGYIAGEMNLAEAINRRILPSPTYISALYTLNEEAQHLLEILQKSNKSDEEKMSIEMEISQSTLDWEKASGIPEVLKRNLTPDIRKFIVFCQNKAHLDEMEVAVEGWFQKAGFRRRKKYRLISGDSHNEQELEDFKNADSKDTIHLMLAIDMLNEGLHISDVGAVILLRPTQSPNVFYQQIGRCIEVNAAHIPIIFDFVNNFQNIRANDFLLDLEEAEKRERKRREAVGLEPYAPPFRIIDETKDILKVFGEIEERLGNWEVMFENLLTYKEEQGDCNVPQGWKEKAQLGTWVNSQRTAKKQGGLSGDKIRRLDEIGFLWDPHETQWEEIYLELIIYKEEHGDCNVPQGWKENPKLGRWVNSQRVYRNRMTLSDDRIRRLGEIGFEWDPKEAHWEERFQELLVYREEHGNSIVPAKWEDNLTLGRWVVNQRYYKKQGTLSNDNIRRLDEIRFVWDPFKGPWEKRFEELLTYKEEHGDSNVPLGWKEKPQLGTWVVTQRQFKRQGRLPDDRIRQLDEIAFEWNPYPQWEEMFQELLAYKKKHGDSNVPAKWEDNPPLGRWVSKQRGNKKQGGLSGDKIRRLDEIGFLWDPYETQWEEIYLELIIYKEEHGNCNVPHGWKENPPLRNWVINQRALKKRGTLSDDKIQQLEDLGFEWSRSRGK